jgi:phage baseplate assembly protein W
MKAFRVPFSLSGGSIAETTDYQRQVEQKIIDVLVTGRFERVMLPSYGAAVQQLLFDSIDELVEVDFRVDAANEVLARVSNVNIVDIQVKPEDESQANVVVYYRTPLSGTQSVTFSVTTALTEETPL